MQMIHSLVKTQYKNNFIKVRQVVIAITLTRPTYAPHAFLTSVGSGQLTPLTRPYRPPVAKTISAQLTWHSNSVLHIQHIVVSDSGAGTNLKVGRKAPVGHESGGEGHRSCGKHQKIFWVMPVHLFWLRK